MTDDAVRLGGSAGPFHAPLVVQADVRRAQRRFWPKLWRTVGRIPFAEDVAAAWYCAVDPRTPRRVKLVLLGAVAYFVMPADMIPDVLVAIGFTDDATVLATALGVVGAHIKPRHRRAACARLGKPAPPPEDE